MRTKSSKKLLHRLRTDKKAVSPAISATIITCAVVVMLLVAVNFVNHYLTQHMAESEFSAMKQFMQTIGLQLDDVSWTIGRTQTVRYASRFGQVKFLSPALNYMVYVNDTPIANFTTGVLFFNMPTGKYNLGNSYHQRIFPANRSFLQQGTSAPVSHVFVIEIVPMNDGNYVRIVMAPSIRMLNSTITAANMTTNYFNFYFPVLNQGIHRGLSQSVTLQGNSVNVHTRGDVDKIRVRISFPNAALGFDNSFFNFESLEEEIDVPDGSILEFYTSEVITSLGLQG